NSRLARAAFFRNRDCTFSNSAGSLDQRSSPFRKSIGGYTSRPKCVLGGSFRSGPREGSSTRDPRAIPKGWHKRGRGLSWYAGAGKGTRRKPCDPVQFARNSSAGNPPNCSCRKDPIAAVDRSVALKKHSGRPGSLTTLSLALCFGQESHWPSHAPL